MEDKIIVRIPAPDLRQQVFKLGISQPKVAVEVVVVYMQFLKKAVKFTELCASLDDAMNPDTTTFHFAFSQNTLLATGWL